jgi:8-oxo-dGTP pyrophosphatase MutT (NUDIX family)
LASEIVERVTRNLVAYEPSPKGLRFAAVSLILRDRQFPSVLLIKRAERPGDPWSGQIAFPGGKMQKGDNRPLDTAIRETMEEVGVDLGSGAEFLGYAPMATTHTGNMEVVPAVFMLKGSVEIQPNEEVASYRWVDLEDLAAPETKTTYRLNYDKGSVEVPALRVDDYVVWGLTQRILNSVLEE